MEIKNYTNAISSYKAIFFEKNIRGKSGTPTVAKNTDKVEFSSQKPASIQGLKAAISQKVESSASAERIQELKSAMNNGEYSVSSEAIAGSVIEL